MLADSLIKTEGLLRVSARAQNVEILKEAYDRGQKFIVWKDLGTTLIFPTFKEGIGSASVQEVDQIDGYDVHAAAALIKLWYHELREPVFPPTSYQALEKLYNDPKQSPSAQELTHMLSPGTDFSPIPDISRTILITHLLPFAAQVAQSSDQNRMTPTNLAVVFAPNLVCGPDPIEDLKILSIAQRLLAAMIMHWTADIAPALRLTSGNFESSLRTPEAVADWEDPLEEILRGQDADQTGSDEQTNGIILLDNDGDEAESSSEEDVIDDGQQRPPLPPRPQVHTLAGMSLSDGFSQSASPVRRKPTPNSSELQPEQPPAAATPETENTAQVRRKPAPAVVTLPRYSTIVTDRPAVMAALANYDTNHRTGETPASAPEAIAEELVEPENLPPYDQSMAALETPHTTIEGPSAGGGEDQQIPRKPVGKANETW